MDSKKDYFVNNDKLLSIELNINSLYSKQPIRIHCKLCLALLPSSVDFHSHGVDYIFCDDCSHLNGKHDDTQEFINSLYIKDNGSEYSIDYVDPNWIQRVSDIYSPKVDFLLNTFKQDTFKLLDAGCGCGYFVFAALNKNIAASGFDVSKSMVDFGNDLLNNNFKSVPLSLVNEQGFYDKIINSDANVISAIGVIEHLRDPHKFFDAFNKSRAQYIYYSVPMFSFSSALENIFQEVYPRQLSGGHTHLFTEKSLKKLNSYMHVNSIAEWRFGTDSLDLFRHLIVMLEKRNSSKKFLELMKYELSSKLDIIQSVFDRSHFCSEIHCIAEKI